MGPEPRPGLKEAVGRPGGVSGLRLNALLICRPFSSVWPSTVWGEQGGKTRFKIKERNLKEVMKYKLKEEETERKSSSSP